jgi:hypothetical protein
MRLFVTNTSFLARQMPLPEPYNGLVPVNRVATAGQIHREGPT